MDSAVDTPTVSTPPLVTEAPLTAADRCDRCGAQAYVRATLPAGGDLLMCGHHANAHRAALLVAGASIHDETDRLLERREPGLG